MVVSTFRKVRLGWNLKPLMVSLSLFQLFLSDAKAKHQDSSVVILLIGQVFRLQSRSVVGH